MTDRYITDHDITNADLDALISFLAFMLLIFSVFAMNLTSALLAAVLLFIGTHFKVSK
jgi:hypothetical protein